MRSFLVTIGVVCALALAGPALAAPSPSVAALQVALRAAGHYTAPVDGVVGPQTRAALDALRAGSGITGETTIGPRTRAALGALGRPLLGQRELLAGAAGWDVSALEFQLQRFGLPHREVDGHFTVATAAALRRFQSERGLTPDGIAGKRTFQALVVLAQPAPPKPFTPPVRAVHVVQPGESFFSIGQRYGISPLLLAQENDLHLSRVIVPGQRLVLPAGVTLPAARSESTVAKPAATQPVGRDAVRGSLDRWSTTYGVDPQLARAVAWMESGFQQDVVSHAGAIGVMQLLPETWDWLDTLLGVKTPRTYDGNIRAGVRYLRWLLDEFDGDVRLALAGYYQGARAVRERGLFEDTKRYVSVVLQLRGTV